jgi:hypothetical protein
VQQAILGGLRELASAQPQRFATLYDITVHLFGRRALDPVPRAHIESVRRALITLERGGYVDLTYVNATTGEDPGAWRRQLAARIRR